MCDDASLWQTRVRSLRSKRLEVQGGVESVGGSGSGNVSRLDVFLQGYQKSEDEGRPYHYHILLPDLHRSVLAFVGKSHLPYWW